MRKLIRTLQVYAPGLVDLKFAAQHRLRATLRRPFEYDFRAIKHFPNDGDLFIDVGAHRGQSIQAIRLVANHPRIEAFEPNPLLARRLSDVHNVALADAPGVATLHVPVYRGYLFDGLTSLSPAHTYLSSETLYRFDPSKLVIRRCEVEVRTLDSYEFEPFFIKIDVEGGETAVLRGAARTIERSRPILLLETPDREAVTLLEAYGYSPFTYRGGAFWSGRNPRQNTYFLTAEHIERAGAVAVRDAR